MNDHKEQQISPDDLTNIQNSLLDAVNKQRDIAQRNYQQQYTMQQRQANNANNAAGTLFSTRPTYQMANFAAQTYMPKMANAANIWGQTTIKTKNTVADALKKIQAFNDAAAKLNSMPF